VFADQQDADDLLDAWWTQVVYHGSLPSSTRAFGGERSVFPMPRAARTWSTYRIS
jgi:hypothetical protein